MKPYEEVLFYFHFLYTYQNKENGCIAQSHALVQEITIQKAENQSLPSESLSVIISSNIIKVKVYVFLFYT